MSLSQGGTSAAGDSPGICSLWPKRLCELRVRLYKAHTCSGTGVWSPHSHPRTRILSHLYKNLIPKEIGRDPGAQKGSTIHRPLIPPQKNCKRNFQNKGENKINGLGMTSLQAKRKSWDYMKTTSELMLKLLKVQNRDCEMAQSGAMLPSAWWPEFDTLKRTWKKRINSCKLSSDLHKHAMTNTHTHTLYTYTMKKSIITSVHNNNSRW